MPPAENSHPDMDSPKGCCESPANSASGSPAPACCADPTDDRPGYSLNPFVCGWLDTPVGQVPQVSSRLSLADIRGRWAMRWGIGRDRYRIAPGLYAVGTPDENSPLLVTANYKLSFDSLRSALPRLSAWLLVIETRGVNVWCAAGKGTFGSEEIIHRCRATRASELVKHRRLILPQLGAPGVAAHQVKREAGFTVVYGPIRARDIPAFLAADMQASEKMRQVTFTLLERTVLAPVELTTLKKPILLFTLALFLLGGVGADFFSFQAAWSRGLAALLPAATGLLCGSVLTPILLPWLPGRHFAFKGAICGLAAAGLLTLSCYRQASPAAIVALILAVTAIASYTAMNFTGSTTYTSPSGVEKEMRLALPWQAGSLLAAGAIWMAVAF